MTQSVDERVALLEARVKRQEGRLKLLKCGYALVLTAAGIAMLAGAKTTSDQWEGRKISIRDDRGRVRTVLDVKDDLPMLTFYDQKGKGRLELRLTPVEGDPGVFLYDDNGKLRASLEMIAYSSFLIFRSEKGEEHVTLANRYNNESSLSIFMSEEKQFWKAP